MTVCLDDFGMSGQSQSGHRLAPLVEEISMNAWPSLRTVLYDGWVLRFAGGYTGRANSVNPIFGSSLDITDKTRHCEHLYWGEGQDCIFKISPAAVPAGLDAFLAEQGYKKRAPTAVQTLDLDSIIMPGVSQLEGSANATTAWLHFYRRIAHVDERYFSIMERMLHSIEPPACFVSVEDSGQVVAAGFAVVERGYVGLFDIASDPRVRNRGLGTDVVRHLLWWGKQNGARRAYLQVTHDNAPALHLYKKLGFEEKYSYWYRVKSGGCW